MNKATLSRDEKNRGGVNRNYAHFIPSTKVSAFETLYKSLLKHYGTGDRLEKELKIGSGLMKAMFKDKKLSQHYAKKILDKFNEVKKIKQANQSPEYKNSAEYAQTETKRIQNQSVDDWMSEHYQASALKESK
jgi:hypothetical protein